MARRRKLFKFKPIDFSDDAVPFSPDGKTTEQRISDRREYRQRFVSNMLSCIRPPVTKENYMAKSMWNDGGKVEDASNLRLDIYNRVDRYLGKRNSIKDASEILASLVNPEILKRISIEKFGLIDPNDPLN
jgi:hypothetical protein